MKSKIIKRISVAAVVACVLVTGGIWWLTWLMSQPLYAFGSVAASKNLRGPLTPPRQTHDTFWQVESDISLSFERCGEGTPVLVVHGGPGIPYADQWNGLMPLTDQFSFYYYHQRGCGDSTRPFDRFDGGSFYENMIRLERTLGLGAQIADIERIRRILGQEKLILIGHSFGGFIAGLYAAEFSEHVDRLILVAPAGVLTPPDKERNLFELARQKLDANDQPRFDSVMEQYLDFSRIFSKSDDELINLHEQVGRFLLPAMGYSASDLGKGPRSGGWSVFAMYFSTGTAQDYRPALSCIKAPTLIIHGADDTISLAGARTYEAISKSRFVLIDGEDSGQRAGHFVFDDSPEKFGAVVEKFLTP